MNFKLALAAAAVVGIAGTANAADLAKKAPAAANYVKVCDAYGAGFFYIPGSDTCLKIGGFVRAEYRIYGRTSNTSPALGGTTGWNTRAQNGITTRARADFNFDARTNTEMGLLRSFIDVWMTADSAGNGTVNGALPITSLRKAFIQFGGLTAGRATSFFDFYTGTTNSVFHIATSDANVNLLAYTQSFGNGISASLSIEDASTSDETSGLLTWRRRSDQWYAGVKTPDLVGNINVTQAWGSAQLSGVLHDNYGPTAGKLGYAVQGGVRVNLPMLGAGDTIALQASYAKGAVGYINGGGIFSNAAWTDFVDNGAGTAFQASAWAIAGGLTHNWTKTVASNLGASYFQYNGDGTGFANFKQIDVQGNVVWAPVSGLALSANVEYRHVDRVAPATDGGAYVGFVRIQRNF